MLSFTVGSPVVGFDKSTKSFAEPVVIFSSPLVTLVILFPPLLNPSFVNFTGFAGSFLEVIVIPFPSTLVVFPSLSVTVVPPAFITVVISFVGSVASFPVIVVPVGVVTTEFPLSSLTSTLLKLVNFGFNEYVNSFSACLIFKLSPALNVTVSPALISASDFACPTAAAPLPSVPDVAFHAALFIAFTTVSTVVNLFSSPALDLTFPVSFPVAVSIVPFSTSGTVTSTVTVCFPFPSVVALTTALFFPINSTSFAFFTCAENALVKSPVVLSLETTHPIFLKSPTVATFEFGVVVVLLKSTNPFLFPEL